MYFDALTLAAVVSELRQTIVGGRIQRALLPSPLSVALEVYAGHRRHHLLLSAHPRFARVHLSQARPSRGVDAQTPLLLLLRKYAVRGWILSVEQPDLERVLVLSIAKRPPKRNTGPHATPEAELPAHEEDDEPDQPPPAPGDDLLRCELIVEAMDQRSNIVLVGDNNIILGAARIVTPKMSRRPIVPGEPYELPPPQEKRDPRHTTATGVQALAEGAAGEGGRAGQDLARALVGAYRGLSPLAAREAVFRAVGRADAPLGPDLPWERVAAAVRGLVEGEPEPCLVPGEDAPAAYAPYMLTHMPGARPVASISAAIDAFYAPREQLTAHSQRRAALRQRLLEARERLERQRAALASELERARELDQLRWEGEMIFAFMHTLQPRQAELEVEGRRIALDARKSPVENAQERFRAYDKAKGALEGVPERLRAVEAKLAGLDETLALLELAEGYEQIEAMAREAQAEGYLPASDGGRKGKPARPLPPLRLESSDGYTIYVGRSAGQNQQVTFRLGAPDDLWLHARGIPGAHVIIKSGGRAVPERTLLEAAGLAAYFSAGRGEASVEVEVARRSQVRRVRGGPTGLVTYHAERAVRVAPRPPW
ncbi:MAG TPA: NFACT RNA binding domain-containing protein [Roseiflexaceae bacterium]|nr:NFACT RNA binding domain-containing protein [Roseiflexaceae bacterium]